MFDLLESGRPLLPHIDTTGRHAGPGPPTPPPHAWALWLSALVSLVAVIFLLSIGGGLAFTMPRFRHAFSDFDTELPTITLWLVAMPWWVLLGGPVVLSAGVGLVQWKVRDKRVPLAVGVGALLLGVVAAAVAGAALFVPMLRMMQSMQ